MNAEKLYDAFAQIDEDLIGDAAVTVRAVKKRSVNRIFKAAAAVFVVTLIFAAAEFAVFAAGARYADMTLGEYFGKVFRNEITEETSGVVAKVNGEPVHKSSLDYLMQLNPNVDEKTALESLITEVLVTQEAKKRGYGVRVSDADAENMAKAQKQYFEQIASLPESEQPESVRTLLSYLSENNITIEEYFASEHALSSYRSALMRGALLDDIAKGETDPDKIVEIIENFKTRLRENAEIEILLTEEQPFILYGDYMNGDRDMVAGNGKTIDEIVKTVGQRCVDEQLEFARHTGDAPKDIYCDINIYYVSYAVSGLNDLTSEAISKAPNAWPYIHIPIFCTYEGETRVFGEVLVKPTVTDYNKWTWDYVTSTLSYHILDTEPYKSGADCQIWTVAPTEEELARLCVERGIGEYKAAMLFFYREQWNQLLLIQTDTGEYVYDIGDTLRRISWPLTNDKIRVYTLHEYEEIAKENDGKSGIGGGGIGAGELDTSEKKKVGGTVLWIAGAVLLCYVAALAAVIVKMKGRMTGTDTVMS
jgi:hypothetical protein